MFTSVKFLCTLVTLAYSLEVEVAPYGVVTVKEGTARIQTGTYELLIITQRPASLQQQYLDPLLRKAQALFATARQGQVVDVEAYVTRFQRLLAPIRTKRGLINAVGELTKSLFGIATVKDVNKIKATVNDLVQESNERRVVVRDLIICVNETITQQQKIEQKVNVLAEHVNQLQRDIQTLSVYVDEDRNRLFNAELLIIIENVLSLAEELYNAEKDAMNYFRYNRDLAVIGHLTETLVPRSILKNVREEVQIDVSDEYLYTNLEVKIMELDGDSLGYWVSLPILEGEPYTLWRIQTVPFPVTGDAHRQIIPEVTTVGHGLETGNFIEADLCKFDNPRLCPSPVEYDDLKCVSSILSQDNKQIRNCKIIEVDQFDINVKRVSPNSVVMATDGEKVEERCYLQPPQSYQLQAKTYLLNVKAGCVLEGENWKFQAAKVERKDIELESLVLLLPSHFSVNVTVPKKLNSVKFNYTNVSALIAEKYGHLPDVDKLRDIKIVMLSGSAAGYIALLMIIIIVIGVLVYRYIKRKNIKKREIKFEPTITYASESQVEGKEEIKVPPIFKEFCGCATQSV